MKIIRWENKKGKFNSWHEPYGLHMTMCGKTIPMNAVVDILQGVELRKDKIEGKFCWKCFE